MSLRPRLAALLGAVLLLTLVAWWATRAPQIPNSNLPSPISEPLPPSSALPTPNSDHPLLAGLNAPDSTIQRDLTIVAAVFDAWLTNFTREGHPVGENHEITAALTGRNALGLVLLPADHPAINARGEWCDRWGTPYFFHQVSGTVMELRSAGPDRRLHTTDDTLWSPTPDQPSPQD